MDEIHKLVVVQVNKGIRKERRKEEEGSGHILICGLMKVAFGSCVGEGEGKEAPHGPLSMGQRIPFGSLKPHITCASNTLCHSDIYHKRGFQYDSFTS